MPEYTGGILNLVKPSMDNNLEDDIPALAVNMQSIDDKVSLMNTDLTDKTNILNFPAMNLVTNNDFSQGTTGWQASNSTISAADSVLTMLASAQWGQAYQFIGTVTGHKYYFKANVKASSSSISLLTWGTYSKAHSGSNQYEILSGVWSAQDDSEPFIILDSRASGWDNVYIKEVMLIDLTATFGSGFEPSAEEMDDILSKFTYSWFGGTVNPLLNLKEAVAYLNKNKTNVVQEDIIVPTLLNGWTNYQASTSVCAGYWKDASGNVHLQGFLKGGALNQTIFNLPVGYRPSLLHYFPVEAAFAFGVVYIDSNGNVTASVGSMTSFSIDGISFRPGV